jgi:hypothetical protein
LILLSVQDSVEKSASLIRQSGESSKVALDGAAESISGAVKVLSQATAGVVRISLIVNGCFARS